MKRQAKLFYLEGKALIMPACMGWDLEMGPVISHGAAGVAGPGWLLKPVIQRHSPRSPAFSTPPALHC